MTAETKGAGPIEDRELPQFLTARVIQPGPRPRLHGYDVQGDLARHYRFGEVVLLALTGEAPGDEAGRAFEVAMIFVSTVPIGEAPTHAASVTRLCGARTSSVTAVAALGLAEQARCELDARERLLAWLATGDGPLPEASRARDDEQRAATARLREALGPAAHLAPALSEDLAPDAAVIAVFFGCGLTTRERIEVALGVARLPATCAEALTTRAGAFREYPMNLPPFRYVEDDHAGA